MRKHAGEPPVERPRLPVHQSLDHLRGNEQDEARRSNDELVS
jgi:hypothetical protein